MNTFSFTATANRGAVLLVTLVLLLVMSLLVTASLHNQTLQTHMQRRAAVADTLYQLTHSALARQFEALKDDSYRRRVTAAPSQPAPLAASSPGKPTMALPLQQLAGVAGGNYQQQGSISLVDTSIRAMPGYSANKVVVRVYEITVITTEIYSGQSHQQTLGVAHLSLPGGQSGYFHHSI